MGRSTLAALVLAYGVGGCAGGTRAHTGTRAPRADRRAARAALIELIRSPDAGELNDFPLERFVGDGVGAGAQAPSWGPFSLHLKERAYTYSRAFGQPPRVCRWHYRGAFELRAGRWVALLPQVESQALGPE